MLEGTIPDGFDKVMNTLEILHLSRNKLQGEIPSFFGNMCTLQSLYLSNNKLNGEFSSFFQNSSWCNRHIFKTLILTCNRISGMLPESIGLLSELEHLSLDGNSLEGDVTQSHFSNVSKLEYLYVSENSLSLKFEPNWVPPFQLLGLGLVSCKLGPTFPSWLKTQSSLYHLDISDNGINDSVPDWFWNNMQNILLLNMSHNYLIGAIPNISLKHLKKASVFLNSNQFEGKIPSFLLKASELVLRNNGLMGELPSSLKNCTSLFMLDLSENILSGPIPSWIGKSMQQLIILNMRGNHLSGNLPIHLCYLKRIQLLDLSRNNLSRGIPTCLNNLTAMSEQSINSSDTVSHIYWYNNTYDEIYGYWSGEGYTLDITWMWKGVERGFKNPELKLISIDLLVTI